MAELVHISVVLNKVIEELIELRDSISTPNDTPVKEVKEPIKTISLEEQILVTFSTITFDIIYHLCQFVLLMHKFQECYL